MNIKHTDPIVWPETHFTIDDVQTKYPEFVNITLRFRVKRAEELGDIVCIGNVRPPIGRPRKVFVKAKFSVELLEAAKKAGVRLDATRVKVLEMKLPTPKTEVVTA